MQPPLSQKNCDKIVAEGGNTGPRKNHGALNLLSLRRAPREGGHRKEKEGALKPVKKIAEESARKTIGVTTKAVFRYRGTYRGFAQERKGDTRRG